MQECLLTIVTVTKNCAGTLAHTLASVRQIKGPEIEYLIVDGASTDDTLAIVHRFETLVDRIISEPDTGIYDAMNKGTMLARGRYVLFLNGDDLLLAQGFPAALAAMRDGISQIICGSTLVGSEDAPIEVLVPKPARLYFFNSIPHPSSFVTADLLRKMPFRTDLRIASDYDFFLRAYLAGYPFTVLGEATALHQRGGASGNVAASAIEVDRVRRERLGWRYPLARAVHGLYRFGRRCLRRV